MAFRLIGCAAAAITCVAAAPRAPVRVVGSDILGDEFTRQLLAFAAGTSETLALAFDGSRRGLEELKAGRADLALLVSPPKADALESFATVPIGYHAIIVAVPANCPLNEIALPQLARAFGAAASPGIARWQSVGVTDAWAAEPLIVIAPKPGSSLLVDYFRKVGLEDGEWKPGLRPYASPAELAAQFSDDTKAMALVAHERELPPGVKVLAVKAEGQRRACLPTPANLHAGDYPLRLPLEVVFRRDRRAKLESLLLFLLSDAAADLLDRARIIPLAAEERARVLARLEKL